MFQIQVFLITLYCIVTAVLISSISSTSLKFTQRHFYLQRNPRRGPLRLGNPWVDRSRQSCGKTCMTKYSNCTSFLFNSSSGLCTPGAYINEKQPLPSSAEGDFFQSFYCDTSKGFSVKRYLNTTACVVVKTEKTYAAADVDCQSRGAYLMSTKTVEQYRFLANLVGGRGGWIGCDDINQEGKFVWKDDGQVMTHSERVTLFAVGEPNDRYGSEDCVIYYSGDSGLLDSQCSDKHAYVCEMPYRH